MTTKKPIRPSVKLVAGHATTTSTAVAQFFGKRHDDVLKRIRQTIADCPPEYHHRNFAEVIREVDSGKGAKVSYAEYQLTRDGFTLLAMGFTGKAALAWKIKYIEAFNKLEARAAQRAVVVATRKNVAEQAAERRKALPVPESKSIPQSGSLPHRIRWLTLFENGKWYPPQEVPYWAHVITKDQILERIRKGDEHFDKNFVSEISSACADRFRSEFGNKLRLTEKQM